MPSPVTSADFDVPNFAGNMCSQLRQILEWGAKMKIWFAWAFDAQGNPTTEYLQLFVSKFIPVGSVIWMPANQIPAGYLVANGQEVSKATYANLFIVYGTSFGVASNPTDNFKLPDMQGKFPIGAGGSYPFYTAGGEATHVLTVSEMPAHTHTSVPPLPIQAFDGALGGARNYSAGNDSRDVTLSTEGGDVAHNNMPPYLPGYWLIKAL